MPLKSLKVTFDIDIETFVRVCAAAHTSMNIQAFTDSDPRVSHTKQIGSQGMRTLLIDAFKKTPKLKMYELRAVLVEGGFSGKSLNNLIHMMLRDKLIRHAGYGTYALSKRGAAHG